MPNKPVTQQSLDVVNDNILVIVGRLLEATKAASDGIKTLSDESKTNSASVQVAQQAINSVKQTVMELDRIVRTGNGDSLVTQIKLLIEEQNRQRADIDEVTKTVERNSKRLDAFDHQNAGMAGSHKVLWYIGGGIAWLVTTGIALYGVIHGK